MEVKLLPESRNEARASCEPARCCAHDLARIAIEAFVDQDDWFLQEVEKGLAQIDCGEVLTHEAVGTLLEKRLTERQPRP